MCHHREQTSLNLLFIAVALQKPLMAHLKSSLLRDASLFSELCRGKWSAFPLTRLPPPSLLMIIIIFPLFIMSHTPPLRSPLISTSSVRRCKLWGPYRRVTSRLAAGGRRNEWRMNTHFEDATPISFVIISSHALAKQLSLRSQPHGWKCWWGGGHNCVL